MRIFKKIGYWVLAMIILGFSWISMTSRNSGATMAESFSQSIWVLIVIGLVLAIFLCKFDMDK